MGIMLPSQSGSVSLRLLEMLDSEPDGLAALTAYVQQDHTHSLSFINLSE